MFFKNRRTDATAIESEGQEGKQRDSLLDPGKCRYEHLFPCGHGECENPGQWDPAVQAWVRDDGKQVTPERGGRGQAEKVTDHPVSLRKAGGYVPTGSVWLDPPVSLSEEWSRNEVPKVRWHPNDLDRCEHGRHSIDHCFDCTKPTNKFLMAPSTVPVDERVRHHDGMWEVRIGTMVRGEPIWVVVRDAPRETSNGN